MLLDGQGGLVSSIVVGEFGFTKLKEQAVQKQACPGKPISRFESASERAGEGLGWAVGWSKPAGEVTAMLPKNYCDAGE